MSAKNWMVLIFLCIITTALTFYFITDINHENLQQWLMKWGNWTPIIYITIYILGTFLLLPSTPLNISGGALFGLYKGIMWTSIGAIIAALITFAFTRTIGREWVKAKLAGRWEAVEADIYQKGFFYLFAARLLPILPYGLVNMVAGLTSVTWRDYSLATIFGTVLGLLPFIAIGSYGLSFFQGGSIWGLILAIVLVGSLFWGAIWYRQKRTPPSV